MTYARDTLVLHSSAPDLIPQDAPQEAWNVVANALFRNLETIAATQDRAIFPEITGEPRAIVYVEPFNQGFWVIATEAAIHAYDGTTAHDITPAGWTGDVSGAVWTACVINGLAVINCSTRDPVWWDGNTSNVMTALPDWPSGGRCLCMRAHKNSLFAVGMISEGGERVRWSDAAEAGVIPQSWTPAADTDAGFVDLAPLYSDCLDAIALRDDLVVFKRHSVWTFTLTGGNEVFTVRQLFAEHGIMATNAVTRGIDDQLVFAGADGDVYMTDGVQAQSVLDGRAQRQYHRDVTSSPGVFSAVTLDREKLALIIYPTEGAGNGQRMLALDLASGDIGFRDAEDVWCAGNGRMLNDVGDANTWDGATTTWNTDTRTWNQKITSATVEDVLIGTAAGMHHLGADETAYTVQLEKSGLAFGNPQMHKLGVKIWPKIIGRSGDVVTFRFGGQDQAGGPYRLSAPVEYVIGSPEPLSLTISGRFLAVHVSSSETAGWRMGSMDIEYRELGRW